MYLICHVTSQDHLIEGSCKFMGGSSSLYVTTLTSSEAIGSTIVEMFLICHLTLRDHMFKGLREFMEGRSSRYVTTWPSLMAIGQV